MTDLTVALVSIARPTFDVPLAQSVADTAAQSLADAGMTIVGPGAALLMDGEAAAAAVDELEALEFDLLILLQASFADSTMAVAIAGAPADRRVPIVLWAVPDERSGGRLRLNSLCGINLAGHALARRGIGYDYLHCRADDPQAPARVAALARAGRAVRTLAHARIGLVGEPPAGFDTCRYDSGELGDLFGVDVVQFPLPDLLARAAADRSQTQGEFLSQVAGLIPNLASLDADAVAGTASVYSVLREAANGDNLKGIAVRCWPEFFTELGCAACGAMSVLNEEGCPASCEADVNGTITSVLLQALSNNQAFITDLVSIDEEDDTGVLWHCGLAPVSMADPDAEIVGALHSNRQLPLLFEFPLKPGRVTLARLHHTGQGTGPAAYRLVVGGGRMQQAPKSFSGTSGVIRFDAPAATVLDRIMTHGLEHHFTITYGDWQADLRAVARLIGIGVIELTETA